MCLKGVELSADFIVSRWLKCPNLSLDSMKFVGISIGQCVDECKKRGSCTSVIFRYQMNLCEVHLEDEYKIPDDNAAVGGSCSFIQKGDMHSSKV